MRLIWSHFLWTYYSPLRFLFGRLQDSAPPGKVKTDSLLTPRNNKTEIRPAWRYLTGRKRRGAPPIPQYVGINQWNNTNGDWWICASCASRITAGSSQKASSNLWHYLLYWFVPMYTVNGGAPLFSISNVKSLSYPVLLSGTQYVNALPECNHSNSLIGQCNIQRSNQCLTSWLICWHSYNKPGTLLTGPRIPLGLTDLISQSGPIRNVPFNQMSVRALCFFAALGFAPCQE